jgi:hypothetical protein
VIDGIDEFVAKGGNFVIEIGMMIGSRNTTVISWADGTASGVWYGAHFVAEISRCIF